MREGQVRTVGYKLRHKHRGGGTPMAGHSGQEKSKSQHPGVGDVRIVSIGGSLDHLDED